MVKTWVKRLYMAFIFLLLYLPIIVLVVLSFNKSKARVAWRGFTFQWYANLFDNSRITIVFQCHPDHPDISVLLQIPPSVHLTASVSCNIHFIRFNNCNLLKCILTFFSFSCASLESIQ